VAPGVAIAQALGRFGNYFNQELFGRPTTLPWGLEIDPAHRPAGYEQFATYHPTFLYEAIWCVGVALVVIWADRRWTMGHGRAFALYVGLYSVGRGLIESLRIDEAHQFFGIRLNVFTAIVVVVGALVYIVVSVRLRPGREAPESLRPHAATPLPDSAPDEAVHDDVSEAAPVASTTADDSVDP
jgi:prolipoprotein diacylglyceryl transferase